MKQKVYRPAVFQDPVTLADRLWYNLFSNFWRTRTRPRQIYDLSIPNSDTKNPNGKAHKQNFRGASRARGPTAVTNASYHPSQTGSPSHCTHPVARMNKATILILYNFRQHPKILINLQVDAPNLLCVLQIVIFSIAIPGIIHCRHNILSETQPCYISVGRRATTFQERT